MPDSVSCKQLSSHNMEMYIYSYLPVSCRQTMCDYRLLRESKVLLYCSSSSPQESSHYIRLDLLHKVGSTVMCIEYRTI